MVKAVMLDLVILGFQLDADLLISRRRSGGWFRVVTEGCCGALLCWGVYMTPIFHRNLFNYKNNLWIPVRNIYIYIRIVYLRYYIIITRPTKKLLNHTHQADSSFCHFWTSGKGLTTPVAVMD